MGNENLPIGLFDCDYLGLSTLRILHRYLPLENYHFHLDLAANPFHNKSKDIVMKRTLDGLHHLAKSPCKAVVVTNLEAASLFTESPLEGLKIYNPLQISIEMARSLAINHKIGILSDRFTLQQELFVKLLGEETSKETVTWQGAPLLESMIKEQLFEDPMTNLIAYRYLNPMINQGISALILGPLWLFLDQKSLPKSSGPRGRHHRSHRSLSPADHKRP